MKIKHVLNEIKWFIQRGKRGYSDIDVWNIDGWFLNTIVPMLKQFNKDRNGYPSNMTDKEWNNILKEMINCFIEGNEETCSQKNEYEEEYFKRTFRKHKQFFRLV